jgi:hypothetical protein
MKDKRKINAFPVNERDYNDGMYLRDYFAAKTLGTLVNHGFSDQKIAKFAYKNCRCNDGREG